MGTPEAGPPFLPLAFRLFASFGLLVLHAALPLEGRATGPGEDLYLGLLLLLLLESLLESAQDLKATGLIFPVPSLPWIRWNLGLDLLLVTLVIGFHGVLRETFSTLYIFPVLASAFYLGTMEIIWVGTLSAAAHILLVLAFTMGVFPAFGLSREVLDPEPARLSFVLGVAALQVFAVTLVVVLIRRNLDTLRTDLSVSEATVDELQALHQRVVESMHSGLITLDLRDRVTSANPAAETILGQPIAPGTPIRDLLPLGDFLPRLGGREERFEISVFLPGLGKRILGGHLAPLRGGTAGASGQILLFQDLTDFKALEDRTRISERMAAIGQLAAGLAHELRNPLASITGCVQLLRKEDPAEGVSRRVLGILERESQRVGAIVTDFLDFARPAPAAHALLSLPRVCEEVRSSWEMDPRTGGLTLLLDPVPALDFMADPAGLHRALMNLLSNARKAVAGAEQPTISLQCLLQEERLTITVADSGCGMTEDQLNRLFVPFAGTFEEGTGLGMSLVYKFVEAMGWRLEVHSAPGLGTQVEIHIPLPTRKEGMASGAVRD